MGMSYHEIKAIVSELKPALTNGWVQKIYQPREFALTLGIKSDKSYFLHFSIDPGLSRIHLIQKKYANPMEPFQFCMALRKFLTGAMIEGIELSDSDRIVFVRLRRKDGRCKLVAELKGKKSNLVLTDEKKRILFVMVKKCDDDRLSAGNFYILPPIYIHKNEKEIPYECMKSDETGEGNFTFNYRAESYYSKLEEANQIDSWRIELSARLRKKLKKLEEKKRKLEQELDQFNKNEQFLEHGELLKQNLGAIKKGVTEVTLSAPGNLEKQIRIKLDPSLNAIENMKIFFAKYKKALRGKIKIETPLIETGQEILKTREQIENIEKSSPEELEKFVPQEKSKEAIHKKESGQCKSMPHQFLSADNVKILVGKNSSQNDEVTFKYAKGNDLWLHAQDAQGGHVIVSLDKKKEIPEQTLLDGATLALYYSGLKSEGKGSIIYTRKKYVKKPKGSKPGLVAYSQEKIFFIRLEPERVTRLMNSKN